MAHLTSNSAEGTVLNTWLNKNFVQDLEWELQYQKFTTKAVIPSGMGNIGRFISFSPPTRPGVGSAISYSNAGASALTEGLGTQNEITNIPEISTHITIGEFGEFVPVSSMWLYAAVSGAREKLRKRMRDGAAFSIDSYVKQRAQLGPGYVLYAYPSTIGAQASGTTLGATFTKAGGHSMNAAALIHARKVLYDYGATGFENIQGVPNRHYGAVITPLQELDIVTEVTTNRIYWSGAVVNVPGALGQTKFVNGYIGSIYQVAVVTTNNYSSALVTGSVAETGFVFSDGAIGAMAFEDMDPQIILNDVNSPYKNRQTIAWHAMFGAAAMSLGTGECRYVRIYSAST